jgi:hypothetical protein
MSATLEEWLCVTFSITLDLRSVSEFIGFDLGSVDTLEELQKSDLEIIMLSCILERKLYRDIGLSTPDRNFIVMAQAYMDHFESTLEFNYPYTLRELWCLR